MSYGDFHSMLDSVTLQAESTSFDEDGDDSIDAIVRRNINEVVQAANDDNTYGLDRLGPPPLTDLAGVKERQQRQAGAAPSARPGGRISSGGSRRSEGAGGPAAQHHDAMGSSSLDNLDVPGHAEATLRLHKARIRGLEDELGKLTQALSERDKQLAEAKRDVKALKTEQASHGKTHKGLEMQVEKFRRAAADAEAAASSRESALKELGKEGGRVEKEKRAGEEEARARDVRLQRALEEVEKYKGMLGEVRSQEREGKDVAKSEYNRVVAENKRLERQRAELVVAFKKQLRLIDVLKRQKLHLEAARALQFTEQEFLQTLEMGNA